MIYEQIKLTEEFSKLKKGALDHNVTLTSYVLDNTHEVNSDELRPAVIVCPGGGYCFTSDREAEPVALAFLAKGINAFVVRYSVAPSVFPQALCELSAAVAYVRKNHKHFNVDPDRILVGGFSAGGHLAASLGVFWHEDFIDEYIDGGKDLRKPNGLVLSYPVISSGPFAHQGSFDALLGENKDDEKMREYLSLENRVSPLTPPAFIWHTASDDCVKVENSLMFASKLSDHKVKFDLHIYHTGVHGLSLCNHVTGGNNEYLNDDYIAPWIDNCCKWIFAL